MSARRVSFWLLSLSLVACSTVPRPLPGVPSVAPSPKSITPTQPGGDAPDPHEAALLRQLNEPWGWGIDKDNKMRLPLADGRNYERVRYWALDHFVGFKYGSDFHAMNAIFILDVPEGTKMDSWDCMKRAEKWGHPQLSNFEVKLGKRTMVDGEWHGQHIVVQSVDGYVDFGLERHKFSAAYAAYPAYADACLVFGFAVPWRHHDDLAQQVRDRWVKEAVPRIKPFTKHRPFRQ